LEVHNQTHRISSEHLRPTPTFRVLLVAPRPRLSQLYSETLQAMQVVVYSGQAVPKLLSSPQGRQPLELRSPLLGLSVSQLSNRVEVSSVELRRLLEGQGSSVLRILLKVSLQADYLEEELPQYSSPQAGSSVRISQADSLAKLNQLVAFRHSLQVLKAVYLALSLQPKEGVSSATSEGPLLQADFSVIQAGSRANPLKEVCLDRLLHKAGCSGRPLEGSLASNNLRDPLPLRNPSS